MDAFSRAYAKKRVPSWCDRVLARSLSPAHACLFKEYASCPGVRSSDHVPVYASCELAFPRAPSGGDDVRRRDDDFCAAKDERVKRGTAKQPSRASRARLALRVRVSSFRVMLEDDEEEDALLASSPRDEGDEGNAARGADPSDGAVARKGKEIAMGSFFRRAASLKTSASNHPRDSSPNASVSSATSATKNAFVSDASAGARGAMDKLTRGARATARFSMTAHRESGDAFVSPRLSASDAHVAAGVTCRPAQPFIARDETDATTTKSEDGRGSEPRTKGGGANVSKKKVSGSSVVAHWAAASLPAIATSRDFDAAAGASGGGACTRAPTCLLYTSPSPRD